MSSTRYLLPRPYVHSDRSEWLRMRLALWPEGDAQAHLVDMDVWLARPDTIVLVVPRVGGGGRSGAADLTDTAGLTAASGRLDDPDLANTSCLLVGFAEVGTRSGAEGCETSPVAYLEGWYVDPDMRREGVGAALVRAAEDWARSRGFRELASDTQLANATSQLAHSGLGFVEMERSVLYRKVL